MFYPGEDFTLIYLQNLDGEILDWKSQWLNNRRGQLKTRIWDVNGDGIQDFCFLCRDYKDSDQLLSAYFIRDSKFFSATAEHFAGVDVEFEGMTNDDGIEIQPQLKSRYVWQTEKLYEIPLKIINHSTERKRFEKYSIEPVIEPSAGYRMTYQMNKQDIAPGESTDALVTVGFTQAESGLKIRFKLVPMHE